MTLIIYPPDLIPPFTNFEVPELTGVKSGSITGFETEDFFKLYEYVLTKELFEDFGYKFSFKIDVQTIAEKLKDNIEDKIRSTMRDKGIFKIFFLRYVFNSIKLLDMIEKESAKNIKKKLSKLKRGFLSYLFAEITSKGFEMLLAETKSSYESYMYKTIFLNWRNEDKGKLGKIFENALGLKRKIELEILNDLKSFIEKEEFKTLEDKIFFYRLWKYALKDTISLCRGEPEFEKFWINTKTKFEKIRNEIARELSSFISNIITEANEWLISVYVDIGTERKRYLNENRGKSIDEVKQDKMFLILFAEEYERLKEFEDELKRAKSIDKIKKYLELYKNELSNLGFTPSKIAMEAEKRMWELKLSKNFPEAIIELENVKEKSSLLKELWEEKFENAELPIHCVFNGKEVYWFPKNKIVFGRFREGVDIVLRIKALKRMYITVVINNEMKISAQRKEDKKEKIEIMFTADGVPVYEGSRYKLKDRGRIYFNFGFFMDYEKMGKFLCIKFNYDDEVVEKVYGYSIKELWSDYEEFTKKEFLIGEGK